MRTFSSISLPVGTQLACFPASCCPQTDRIGSLVLPGCGSLKQNMSARIQAMATTAAAEQKGPSLKMVEPFNQEGIYASSLLSGSGTGTDQGLTPPPMMQSGRESQVGARDDRMANAELCQPASALTPPESAAETCSSRASCEVEGQHEGKGHPCKRRKLSRDHEAFSQEPGVAFVMHAKGAPMVSTAFDQILEY